MRLPPALLALAIPTREALRSNRFLRCPEESIHWPSVFSKLFEASGVAYPALCERLVELALERYAAERSYRF